SDGLDLGAGDRRSEPLSLDRSSPELLRADGGAEQLGRQTEARADQQAAQSTFADRADRSGQAGATLELGLGSGARARTGARQPQARPCRLRAVLPSQSLRRAAPAGKQQPPASSKNASTWLATPTGVR